ncbi:hypothetical protein FRC02_011035 [Tulasnella sp. 418]|nr:hypothetical protein FRC02_011035 [Tulasnella sp. 418]
MHAQWDNAIRSSHKSKLKLYHVRSKAQVTTLHGIAGTFASYATYMRVSPCPYDSSLSFHPSIRRFSITTPYLIGPASQGFTTAVRFGSSPIPKNLR